MKNYKFFKPEIFSTNHKSGVEINKLLLRRLSDLGVTTADTCCSDGTQTIDQKIAALRTQVGTYKEYKVLVSQTGTAFTNSTVKLLIPNTIGTITAAYVSPGVYTLNSAALFTANKSEGWISNNKGVQYNMSITRVSTSQYVINTWDATGAGTLANALMTDTPVTIRVWS
jgi:hypothetical protein